ncbi:MAG TPA: ABC transporter permease subunit [Pseudonocardia sp.]|nr:ABC transporter permease subunit [Pseudonocardia sp.]
MSAPVVDTAAGLRGRSRAVGTGLARVWPAVALGVLALAGWELVVRLAGVPAFLLPTPSAIGAAIAQQPGVLVSTSLVTGGNAAVGLVAGFLLGLVLALLATWSRLLRELTTPIVLAASAVPIVALAPVFTTMFGSTTEVPRRLVVTIVVLVPVFISTARGLRQVRPVHDELMTALAASPWQHARFVRLPGAVPHIMTGLRLAAPAAVIAAIVAEYFGGLQNGLGSRVSSAAANTAYARAWAFVAASIVLGLLFHLAGLLVERLATRGRPDRPT